MMLVNSRPVGFVSADLREPRLEEHIHRFLFYQQNPEEDAILGDVPLE